MVAESALADPARALALHTVAAHCTFCCIAYSWQLQQVVRASDQVPFTVDLLQGSQQESSQTSAFLDLAVHRLHDRLALGVDP